MKILNEFAAVVVMACLVLSACLIVSQSSPQAADRTGPIDPSSRQLPPERAALASRCAACGVVQSSRAIETSSAGAERQAAIGSNNRARQQRSTTSIDGYEVVVRMEGGAKQVFRHAPPANWRAGERLILIAGTPSK